MDQSQRDEWEALVKSAFRSDADVKVTSSGDDFEAKVSWPLPTKDRKHKQSKTIRLIISREAILGSANKDESRREQDRQKVKKCILNELRSFDAGNDSPISQLPQEVTWTIGSDVLNS